MPNLTLNVAFRKRGYLSLSVDPLADRWRNAPTAIAVHRRGAYGPRPAMHVHHANDLYPSTVYTHIPPQSNPNFQNNPFIITLQSLNSNS
jgi:hypothetical protein